MASEFTSSEDMDFAGPETKEGEDDFEEVDEDDEEDDEEEEDEEDAT